MADRMRAGAAVSRGQQLYVLRDYSCAVCTAPPVGAQVEVTVPELPGGRIGVLWHNGGKRIFWDYFHEDLSAAAPQSDAEKRLRERIRAAK